MSNEKLTFIVDAMLGKLAKKLRLLGFDSIYSSDIEDQEILDIAKKDNRILITKDVQLAQKASKHQISTIPITKSEELDQFIQINEKVKLGQCTISGSHSRCPQCNGELEYTELKKITGKVPDGVLERNEDFWTCKICKKIYWEGTHIKNLQKFTSKLNERI